MDELKKVSVDIYGHSYTLRVAEENIEKVIKVAKHVDEMMRKVVAQQPKVDFRDAAILAAMNISEEYFQLQHDYQNLLEIINEEK